MMDGDFISGGKRIVDPATAILKILRITLIPVRPPLNVYQCARKREGAFLKIFLNEKTNAPMPVLRSCYAIVACWWFL